MRTLRKYREKTLLGVVDNEKIYLTAPSWNCEWYWGFGYLGNDNCHYHIDGLDNKKNLHDAITEHFGNSFIIRTSDCWTFAELMSSFYKLKEAAEVLGRGGSNLTTNPSNDVIMNKEEVERINNIVLPHIFDEIYKILERNSDNKTLYKKIVELNLEGDTREVISFMKKNSINTDDLKAIKKLSNDDIINIHTFYWKDYHENKDK